MLAIIPAVVIIGMRGDSSVTDLLTLSQVVLALQLPLAMFPLLYFASSSARMGQWRLGWFLLAAGWGSAILITAPIFTVFLIRPRLPGTSSWADEAAACSVETFRARAPSRSLGACLRHETSCVRRGAEHSTRGRWWAPRE